MKYTNNEIKEIVRKEVAKAGFSLDLNEYGFLSIVEECEFYQNEENRPVEAQLDYILKEAIPSGIRSEYF